ncbi:MAG: DMT family transporter [Spirochaetaceae bacterium]|jgi:drug/metabolite transporter (DMT)-like permease|nr:DMT family transporter [Spirochaetaceae bacterium]
MNKRAVRADILLLLTAGIWGFGFVAQSSAMKYVGPFTYNGIRFILGSLSLLPLIFFQRSQRKLQALPETGRQLAMTFAAGTVLFFAVAFQQLGLLFTTAGNAGFITGLYVVLTPVFGIFLKKKTRLPTWIGMAVALGGLYFISMPEDMGTLNPGDGLTIISAVFWACHILLIDHLVQRMDPLVLSSGQFAWCGIYAFFAALTVERSIKDWALSLVPGSIQKWETLGGFFNNPHGAAILSGAAIPILYGGLASVGIAYTLQVVAQRDAPPAHATIILCLEGSFAAFGGIVLLNEKLKSLTVLGFFLMLCAMLITQWDIIRPGRGNSVKP